MADPKETENENSSQTDTEKAYWDEHEKRTTSLLDKWFDKKMGEITQSSRNGGRVTLPKIFADLMWGPEKK